LKSSIAQLVAQAIDSLPELAASPVITSISSTVERTRDARHGDFTTNVAMRLAKTLGRNPREIAAEIIGKLPASELIDKVDIAGPGFINFHVSAIALHRELATILNSATRYGCQATRPEPRVLLEFVSANPTGPLHVGHGRHGAYGATLGNLLEAAGFNVDREYYVNDAGRQMDILGVSVWLRRVEQDGVTIGFPAAGYKGEYIRQIAANLDMAGVPAVSADELGAGLPEDESGTDRDEKRAMEAYVDALIDRAHELLGEQHFRNVREQALDSILDDIKEDLAEFGVVFDRWYREQQLTEDKLIDAALALLDERGMLYEKDGAKWFRATDYGD